MPNRVIVTSRSNTARDVRRIVIWTFVLSVAATLFVGGGKPRVLDVETGAIMFVGIVSGLLFCELYAERRLNAFTAAARSLGYAPLSGDVAAGLDGWPVDGWPSFNASRWSIYYAFDHRADDFRMFQAVHITAYSANSDIPSYLFGVAIHARRAELPPFSIAPLRHGWFNRSEPSPSTFRFDSSFATEYKTLTDDAERLERSLGKRFVSSWRSLNAWRKKGDPNRIIESWRRLRPTGSSWDPGDAWELEGVGDWVFATCQREIRIKELPALTQTIRTLADAIRRDANAS